MHRPRWRLLLLVLLLAAGIGAALSTWSITRQIAELDQRQDETADRIDRLLAGVGSVTSAQQAYVASVRESGSDPVPALIEQVRADAFGLGPHLRAREAGNTLKTIVEGAATLADIEARAQEHIRLGQELMAADLVFSEARSTAGAIASGLRDLRRAEAGAYAAARAAALKYAGTIIAAAALLWLLGAALLIPVPRERTLESSLAVTAPESIAPFAPAKPAPESSPGPDLMLAADLCTAIGTMTTAEELPMLLQRGASILDASGIVLWMAAGEELFVAAAYGYPAQVIGRMGPINRSAINATAAAWRTSALQIVTGTSGNRGAVVAPMVGPDRCIGALAVEMPHGREEDPAVGAVARMFAAQLAAAIAAWPAASAAAQADVPPLDSAAQA